MKSISGIRGRRRNNFTLIELIFVIGILIILVGISWVAGNQMMKKQKEKQTQLQIQMLMTAVDKYKMRYGAYPKQHNSKKLNFKNWLSAIPDGGGTEPYIKESAGIMSDGNEYLDPYEQAYRYTLTDGKVKIWSVGVNGDNDGGDNDGDTKDDISSDDL